MTEFSTAYRAAQTQEEKQKLIQEKYPQADKYALRMLAIARKDPSDPVALQALTWVISQQSTAAKHEAIRIVAKNYLTSDAIAMICYYVTYGGDSVEGERFLREVREKNPHRTVRGMATFSLAQLLQQRAERGLSLIGVLTGRNTTQARLTGEKSVEKPRTSYASKHGLKQPSRPSPSHPSEPPTQTKPSSIPEHETLFEEVVSNFGDVKLGTRAIGDMAKAELFEVRNLGIGKLAPEVSGEDLNGTPFKLSDYRGKIVVIDFWGDW